ncbi:hypothetical protein BDY17DRAFT_351756, partial [Neohortaea acidophila]
MNNRTAGTAATQQQQQQQQQHQPIRSVNSPAMNSYAASQATSRPTPRLQNSQKPPLGNGTGGWGGFGLQASPAGGGGAATTPGGGAAAAGAFAGLGGAAPGLGAQPRPGALSGFAQVMGGGNSQGPIDMSDFPSLSGGPRPQQSNPSSAAGWNSTAIRHPS